MIVCDPLNIIQVPLPIPSSPFQILLQRPFSVSGGRTGKDHQPVTATTTDIITKFTQPSEWPQLMSPHMSLFPSLILVHSLDLGLATSIRSTCHRIKDRKRRKDVMVINRFLPPFDSFIWYVWHTVLPSLMNPLSISSYHNFRIWFPINVCIWLLWSSVKMILQNLHGLEFYTRLHKFAQFLLSHLHDMHDSKDWNFEICLEKRKLWSTKTNLPDNNLSFVHRSMNYNLTMKCPVSRESAVHFRGTDGPDWYQFSTCPISLAGTILSHFKLWHFS